LKSQAIAGWRTVLALFNANRWFGALNALGSPFLELNLIREFQPLLR
jgi:hypothetical protein